MTNLEFADRFDQFNSARVEQLMWIATCSEGRELEDFLAEMNDDDLKEVFPEMVENPNFDLYRDDQEMIQLLIDYSKYGFIAKVLYPTHNDFVFDENGKVVACSVNFGRSRIGYVYAETPEELLNKIEKQSDEMLARFIQDFKKKQVIVE